MDNPHTSLFSYNITQPYPYRWFTPVTILGFIVLTALCSWLNYAAIGFETAVTTSSNPNATVADLGVLHGLPQVLIDKFKPTCQPVNVPVNSQFFTNNTGLKYTLLEVLQHPSHTDSQTLPVLPYSNNILEDCAISSIQLEFSWSDSSGIQFPISSYGVVVRTYAACNLGTSDGHITFSMVSAVDPVPASINVVSAGMSHNASRIGYISDFVRHNETSKASLWWGESVIHCYWAWLVSCMASEHFPTNDGSRTTKGWLAFHHPPNATVIDILDSYFLKVDWRLIQLAIHGNYTIRWPNSKKVSKYASFLNASDVYPSTWWLPAEKLAKSPWSTVLVDLGQSKQSNVLLHDETLESFTADLIHLDQKGTHFRPGPETQPYDSHNSTTGPLGTTPAVIATEYICNVPRHEAMSTIIWTVLVADLVFLQAAWTLFKMSVEHFMVQQQRSHSHDGAVSSECPCDAEEKIRRVQTV